MECLTVIRQHNSLSQLYTHSNIGKLMAILINATSYITLKQEIIIVKLLNVIVNGSTTRSTLVHPFFFSYLFKRLFTLNQEITKKIPSLEIQTSQLNHVFDN